MASARKQLEDETLAKVDLENKVQSLKVPQCSLFTSKVSFLSKALNSLWHLVTSNEGIHVILGRVGI